MITICKETRRIAGEVVDTLTAYSGARQASHGEMATRIAELEAVMRNARAMADHGVHGELHAVDVCDEIHRVLSDALGRQP